MFFKFWIFKLTCNHSCFLSQKKKLNTFFKKAISKLIKALTFLQKMFSLTFNSFQIFVKYFNIIPNAFVDLLILSINFQDFTSLHSYFLFSFYCKKSVCYYHVTYPFQSESTLYSCLNVKELFARNRCDI